MNGGAVVVFAALYLAAGISITFLVYDGDKSAPRRYKLLSVLLWPIATIYALWTTRR